MKIQGVDMGNVDATNIFSKVSSLRGDGGWAIREKNKKIIWYPAQKRNQPGPDGSNISGWYG